LSTCCQRRMQSSVARRAVAVSILILLLHGASAWGAPPLERTQYNLLGTACTIRIYDGGTPAALDAAFDRIAEIESRMTVNRDDSEVIRINASAGVRPVAVTQDVAEVIRAGLLYSSDGDGAYDITVDPLVKLWGIGSARARVPSADEIKRALGLIDYRMVQVDTAASLSS
jgi:FAD:protein FMN transferase